MKKVLIASANAYSFCYAVENHLARSLAGDAQVDALNIFSICTRHSPLYNSTAKRLIVSLNRSYDRFVRPVLSGRDITPSLSVDDANIPALPDTVAELRDYGVNGCRVGLAALSSASSVTTITASTKTSEYGAALQSAWRAAHLSERIGREVSSLGYDEIYIFNGRHCYSRPFCDSVSRNSRLLRYEKGGTEDSFIISDRMIQHPANLADLILSHDFSREEGVAFYERRLAKAAGDQVNEYLKKQVEGHLPEGLRGKAYAVFFTSSSDEFAAITDDIGLGAFEDQFQAVRALVEACSRHGLVCVVRFHPHLLVKHRSWMQEWDFPWLRARGVILLEPDHPADSYTLARQAHCVLSPGSTLGFECSYLGIPNAIVGDWVGGYLGVSKVVRNDRDVEDFVSKPALPADAGERALLYGSFYRRAGTKLSSYRIQGHPHRARLDGRILDPVRFIAHPLRRLIGSNSG